MEEDKKKKPQGAADRNVIEISQLTKDYGGKKGIFEVDLRVKKGEVFGFLGPNGAGKTTTIRNLMGFIRPDFGRCRINGLDCHKQTTQIQENLGYLAGEISFLNDMTGGEMIEFTAAMKGIHERERIDELVKSFELNTSVKIRKMSKGMKQKVGIVCAFMGNPDVIILDEPTSGLDPLMQNVFVELILEEKRKGKTIFMSSHIFEEIEKTCDRVAIIKEGRIIALEDMKTISEKRNISYIVRFKDNKEQQEFLKQNSHKTELKIKQIRDELFIKVNGKPGILIEALHGYQIEKLDIKKENLEEMFLHFYEKNGGAE